MGIVYVYGNKYYNIKMITTDTDLKTKYDNYYSESESGWRMEGAKRKSENIFKVLSPDKSYDKVIEIGAGEGSILHFLDESDLIKSLSALEISTSGIEKIKERKIGKLQEVKIFDGYAIPYPDKFFDLAICTHVIEHVEHPRILLREIKRISKEQVFEIPIDFSHHVHKKADHFLSYGHINIFTPSLFKFLLISEKFTILKEHHSMFSLRIIRMSSKTKRIVFPVLLLKSLIWNIFPCLKKRRPNAYTVLTR
jgi:ubiquinone/menaquinone biosynthesis C-methylase UbiE